MIYSLSLIFLFCALAGAAGAMPKAIHEWEKISGTWRGPLKFKETTASILVEGVNPESLPKKAITVEARAVIDAGQQWGGIFSFAQDNGNYERGFLLGYDEQQFVFWVSTGAGMLMAQSKTAFETGRPYHLAGTFDGETVRIFVDGKLEAETEAKGEIAYPDQAFYMIGGYRDNDEDYPMKGRVMMARLYDEALSAEQVLEQGLANGVEKPLKFATQPSLQFVSPTSARVTWVSVDPGGAAVAFGKTRELGEIVRSKKMDSVHSVILENLEPDTDYFYKIGRAANDGKQFSSVFEFSTTLNFSKPVLPGDVAEKPEIQKGYALVQGKSVEEALDLAKGSELSVIYITNDVETARRFFYDAGAHGSRVLILESTGNLTSGMINFLVADDLDESEIRRLLVPGRGKALLKDKPIELPFRPGSGEWTHQYGDVGNSASSADTLGGATATGDYALAWVGRPGADFGIDRNPRMPAPLSAGGRLFHQGMNRMAALDASNGALLWTLEVPDLRRINLPRDCSNWCADSGQLYVAVKDQAWALDAETGGRVRAFAVPNQDCDWGYIAQNSSMLVGSAVRPQAGYSSFWGRKMWFDEKGNGPGTEKVCSDALFGYALDSSTQSPAWTYQEGLILNSTISINDGRVFFIETRNSELIATEKRRLAGTELWTNQFLVALDAKTGRKLWEQAIDTEDGTVTFYMQAVGDKLLATASNTQFHLYTFDAATGTPLWQKSVPWADDNHSGHFQHPVVMGNIIYQQPNGIDLTTGEILTTKIGRREGCHTYVGAGGALLYRGQDRRVSLWNRETESVTSWPRLRPSCWLSTIPANGMLLMPEAGGGCSCGGWMETSLGFLPTVYLGGGR